MKTLRSALSLVGFFGLLALLLPPAPAAAEPAQFANYGFEINWRRYDDPVQNGQTTRSWTWGPDSLAIVNETWANAAGGQRQVQYFAKARMELNNPNDIGSVTSGMLVREMVGGFVMTGETTFRPATPAAIPVAGDPAAGNPDAPTYASFTAVASVNGGNRAENRVGQTLNQSINKAGTVSTIVGNQQRYAYYDETLGHNILDVFWEFINQSGPIYFPADGRTAQVDRIYDPWQSIMGSPITEPYLTRAVVAGQSKSVIVQLFERRALTYVPGEAVQMADAGQHAYSWLYQTAPSALTGPLWRWQRTELNDGSVVTVNDPSRYSIQFNPDLRYALQADCNQGSGQYTVSGSQLTISPGPMTLILCPPGSQAEVYLAQLFRVTGYVLQPGALSLTLRLDNGVMHFVGVSHTSLTGTDWIATQLNNGRGGVQSVPAGAAPTARFGTDGTVSGSTGCNSYHGPYTVSGTTLTVGNLATTRIACTPEINAQEQAYLAALGVPLTISIVAERLTLRDASGALMVEYRAALQMPAAAVTGVVTYLPRVALAPGWVVEVTLADVSLADAPATVIDRQTTTTTGEQVPIPFTLAYDPNAIMQNRSYAVSARITGPDGRLQFISTMRNAVITGGNPVSGVEIVVDPV